MTSSNIFSIASMFLTSLIAGFSLLLAVRKDATPYPLRLSGAILFLLTFVVCIFFRIAQVDSIYIIGDIALNSSTFLVIYWSTKERDKNGLSVGQQLLEYISAGDQELCFILARIVNHETAEKLVSYIHRAISANLRSIVKVLRLDIHHDAHLSVFRTQSGYFKVVSEIGLVCEHVELLEQSFCYSPVPNGLAGYAIFEKRIISISDLLDSKDSYAQKWISLDSAQTKDDAEIENGKSKTRSIICIPIFSGLGRDNNNHPGIKEPLGVLNLTSVKKKAFDSVPKRSLLARYANRIEILLYCLFLAEQNGLK